MEALLRQVDVTALVNPAYFCFLDLRLKCKFGLTDQKRGIINL